VPSDPTSASAGGRHILLVEDSELVRETTIEFLNELGYSVVAVDSAEDALVELERGRFDLVFTDISLPGMSGVMLVKQAREANPSQRFVISSGYGPDLKKHGLGEGVALLAKPYDLATMESTLLRLLDAPS